MRAALRLLRYWLPIIGAAVSLLVAGWVGPVLAWLLILLAFGLLIDVGTALFAKAGGTGNLWTHRQ
jgi:hypothetical protein